MGRDSAWRCIAASVQGVAHRESGVPCQDVCAVERVPLPNGSTALILLVSDGAGSARAALTGATLTCQAFISACKEWLANTDGADFDPSIAPIWLEEIQAVLIAHAADAQCAVREYACTLIGAVITAKQALFVQMGDGAVVINDGADDYRPVFWPQTGEYANETRFVTDAQATQWLAVQVSHTHITEIALFTDGLQSLALQYHTQQAHDPFFRPLFAQLRAAPPDSSVEWTEALVQFLESPAINQRTHDDKTLILATRWQCAPTDERAV